nr:zinc knuckle CX2CX4HX4C [Tanacetum cinerariifolium]
MMGIPMKINGVMRDNSVDFEEDVFNVSIEEEIRESVTGNGSVDERIVNGNINGAENETYDSKNRVSSGKKSKTHNEELRSDKDASAEKRRHTDVTLEDGPNVGNSTFSSTTFEKFNNQSKEGNPHNYAETLTKNISDGGNELFSVATCLNNTTLEGCGRYGPKDTVVDADKMCFFKFKEEEGMNYIVEQSPWIVNENPLIVQKWNPKTDIEKEAPCNIPIWIKLLNVPLEACNIKGISAISNRSGWSTLRSLTDAVTAKCLDIVLTIAKPSPLLRLKREHKRILAIQVVMEKVLWKPETGRTDMGIMEE